MLLSAVSVLVVAQSSSETPEGLMNNPVLQLVLTQADSSNRPIHSVNPLFHFPYNVCLCLLRNQMVFFSMCEAYVHV